MGIRTTYQARSSFTSLVHDTETPSFGSFKTNESSALNTAALRNREFRNSSEDSIKGKRRGGEKCMSEGGFNCKLTYVGNSRFQGSILSIFLCFSSSVESEVFHAYRILALCLSVHSDACFTSSPFSSVVVT